MIEFLKTREVKEPKRSYGDAGVDIYIPTKTEEFVEVLKEKNKNIDIINNSILINPFEDILIPSGLKSYFTEDTALISLNKSGIATKKKLVVGAQVIDSTYRGEIHIHLINTSNEIVSIDFDSKIVQLVPFFIDSGEIVTRNNISAEEFYGESYDTARGEKGFGSSGLD